MRTLILDLWPEGRTPGQVAGMREILVRGLGEECHVVSGEVLDAMNGDSALSLLRRTILELDPMHVIVLASPIRLLERESDFASLCEDLRGRVVTYWEGDAWGRGKPISPAMRRWMNRADHLIHTGGLQSPETSASRETSIHFAPNSYCHVTFAGAEAEPPDSSASFDIAMIGNNVTRSRIPIPGLTGIPGGFQRWRLARRAFTALGPTRFLLIGRDWPASWSAGPVPFASQAQAIRSARVSINWDHFADYPGYSSDRLAISLIAGRPHVTTTHPRMDWCPGEEYGLIREADDRRVLDRAIQLLSEPDTCQSLGLAAWEWARFRLSTREWARFLLSRVRSDVEPPGVAPWSDLPLATRGSEDSWFSR